MLAYSVMDKDIHSVMRDDGTLKSQVIVLIIFISHTLNEVLILSTGFWISTNGGESNAHFWIMSTPNPQLCLFID